MPQVPMQRTQHPQDELAAALTAELLPTGATRTSGALLLALSNQETGSSANMWNHNVGNITTADDSIDWWSPASGAAKGLHFRAYETLDDGVRDFVRFLLSRPKLWAASGTGDVSQFTQEIRDSKYNPTLDVGATAPSIFSLAKQALSRFSDLPVGPSITLGAGGSSGNGLVTIVVLWFILKGLSNGT